MHGFGISSTEYPHVFCETRFDSEAVEFFADNGFNTVGVNLADAPVLHGLWADGFDGEIWLCVRCTHGTNRELIIRFGPDTHIPLKIVSERYCRLSFMATHDANQEIYVHFDPVVLESLLPIASIIVVPRPQNGIATLSGGTDMDLAAFWSLISEAHAVAGDDCERQLIEIGNALSDHSAAEVVAFSRLLDRLVADADRSLLRDMVGDVDDDAFRSFRLWLVIQGDSTYTRLLDHPRILPDIMASWGLTLQNCACAAMADVADRVHEAKTGQRINSVAPIDPSTES